MLMRGLEGWTECPGYNCVISSVLFRLVQCWLPAEAAVLTTSVELQAPPSLPTYSVFPSAENAKACVSTWIVLPAPFADTSAQLFPPSVERQTVSGTAERPAAPPTNTSEGFPGLTRMAMSYQHWKLQKPLAGMTTGSVNCVQVVPPLADLKTPSKRCEKVEASATAANRTPEVDPETGGPTAREIRPKFAAENPEIVRAVHVIPASVDLYTPFFDPPPPSSPSAA